MTMTGSEAFEAMLAHHGALADGVDRRVTALRAAVATGSGADSATAELLAYIAGEVLPHAAAEERTLYRVAAEDGHLAATLAEMTREHQLLGASAERLATAADGAGAVAAAEEIGSLFADHVAKENDRILPSLAARDGVDLADLLGQMHRLTEAAQSGGTDGNEAAGEGSDTVAHLLRMLLQAASLLADAGHGDPACRLAAEAWGVVRATRPDLAVRATAALHRLVRTVTAESVTFSPGRPAGDRDGDPNLDVRPLAPAQRHEAIFATHGALSPGTAFVLVNDHDPKPLRYQFEAEHAGRFTWDVLQAGPEVWRVRIGRPSGTGASDAPDSPGDLAAGAEPEIDVRRLPHGRRHELIFATFDTLPEGAGFVLVNDHDPKPLRYQFEAQHAGAYHWDYLQAGPEVWRVRIGRASSTLA